MNGSLRFQATDLLREPDAATMRTVGELTTMAAIQQELARTMLPSVRRLAKPAAGRRANAGQVFRVANRKQASDTTAARER